MNQDSKNTIVINNYYYLKLEDIQKIMKSNNNFSFFQNEGQSIVSTTQENENNTFLNKNKENNDNTPENEDEHSKFQTTFTVESKNVNLEINNEKKSNISDKTNLFVVKSKKKIGRKPKKSVIKGTHTKFSDDNILRKIKVKFIKRVIYYINSIIISKNIKKLKLLKPLTGQISQNNSIKYNIKLLYSKLKDILSSTEINGKFKLYEKYYNKNIIDTIYNENIIELIEILEMTYLDVFKIFRDYSNYTGKLVGLQKLDSVIREIELKENDDKYINKFKNVAMNFENYYNEKLSRRTN